MVCNPISGRVNKKVKRKIFYALFLSFLTILPLGCAGDHKNDLGDILARYGKPEETEVVYAPDGISYLILWYWSQGRGFKFKEESYTEMSGFECKERHYWRLVDTYQFTPPSEKKEKEVLKRKLIGGENYER